MEVISLQIWCSSSTGPCSVVSTCGCKESTGRQSRVHMRAPRCFAGFGGIERRLTMPGKPERFLAYW